MDLPLWVLGVVLVLIAVRRIGRFPVRIWQAMAAGALAVLLAGSISPLDALRAIDTDVMLFLFGMFVVGEALVRSGWLYAVSYRVLGRVRSADGLVLAILLAAGLASALLMNDTLAIVGTPLVLRLALEHRISARLLLLTLAFAVTIGSVMSPIGNPQNLLIAVHGGFEAPFADFLGALALPTLLNLLLAYAVLRVMLRREFHAMALTHPEVAVTDPALARLTLWALGVVVTAIMVKMALVSRMPEVDLPLSWIALAGAAPLLLFSPARVRLVRDIDWSTLLFFVAMFVLMASVWQTGVIQSWAAGLGADLTTLPMVMGVSVLLSQLISNVPLVALYLPLLQSLGASHDTLLALAAGSTIAGNLLIIGAASNVIIIQRAERLGATLGFIEFARVGIPLTAINVAVYWLWFRWM